MSILELALNNPLPQYEGQPVVDASDSAYVQPIDMEEKVAPALKAADKGMQKALDLAKFITSRGRNSDNAKACQGLVDDCFMGFDDLRRELRAAQAGDTDAIGKIPAILAAIQESMNPETLLTRMKAYSNKSGEKALPNYVYETFSSLGKVFDGICVELTGVSDVLDVQLQVRNSIDNALGQYKFHGVKPVVAQATPVLVEEIEEAPFNDTELAWFNSPVQERTEPAKASKGFFGRVASVIGDFTASLRRNVPRAIMTGALLSAGCVEPVPEETAPAPAAIPYISNAVPAPLAPDWEISDLRDITHAVRSALDKKCHLSRADLIKEEGQWVHAALLANTAELTTVVNTRQTDDTTGEWLGKVRADEAQYDNVVPTDYPGVLAKTSLTRIVGAHGLDEAEVSSIAYAGLPEYNTYVCPTPSN